MGVWIEITVIYGVLSKCSVAPFVGVWIEIFGEILTLYSSYLSLPSWECGLKFKTHVFKPFLTLVAPFVGVWIEIKDVSTCENNKRQSLPSWECGLKFVSVVANQYNCSRSLRGSVD